MTTLKDATQAAAVALGEPSLIQEGFRPGVLETLSTFTRQAIAEVKGARSTGMEFVGLVRSLSPMNAVKFCSHTVALRMWTDRLSEMAAVPGKPERRASALAAHGNLVQAVDCLVRSMCQAWQSSLGRDNAVQECVAEGMARALRSFHDVDAHAAQEAILLFSETLYPKGCERAVRAAADRAVFSIMVRQALAPDGADRPFGNNGFGMTAFLDALEARSPGLVDRMDRHVSSAVADIIPSTPQGEIRDLGEGVRLRTWSMPGEASDRVVGRNRC
jgi:hypothetical protein